jgi:endonuclease/exonuclease/phosphatase family metal-dependent hydrolase
MKVCSIITFIFAIFLQNELLAQSNVKVMSYNMRIANPPSRPGFTDIKSIANVINSYSPDLVALQEIDVNTDRSGPTLDQPQELSKLTGMNYYFAKAINRSNGQYGVAILSKYPIISKINIPLPVVKGSKAELRNAALCIIELPGKKIIAFISTHLDHLLAENRLLQVNTLIDALSSYRKFPIVLAGDFNSKLDQNEPALETLKEHFNLACNTCPFTFSASNPWTTIDYVFLNQIASKLFRVTEYKTLDDKLSEYASDHLPIVTELELKN